MGEKITGILFVVIVVMLMPWNARAEGNSDIQCPLRISDVKINKQSVKPGDTVEYSFTLTDEGFLDAINRDSEYEEYSCIFDVDVTWQSEKKQYYTTNFKWKGTSEKNKQMKIKGKIPIKKGMQKGNWRLYITVHVGCDAEWVVEDIREKHEETAFRNIFYTDFSGLDFKVSGTKVCNKVPEVDLKSLKLVKKSNKKSRWATFSVKLKKGGNPVKSVEAGWAWYERKNGKPWEEDFFFSYKMKYNKKKKAYQCTVRYPGIYHAKSQLYCITVTDIYGNEDYYQNIDKKKYNNAYKKMVLYR